MFLYFVRDNPNLTAIPKGLYHYQYFLFNYLFFLFIYLSRGIQFSRASLNGALEPYTLLSIKKQGGIKPRNTAWARNGATNVEPLAIINLDCQSLKDER